MEYLTGSARVLMTAAPIRKPVKELQWAIKVIFGEISPSRLVFRKFLVNHGREVVRRVGYLTEDDILFDQVLK